MAELADALASGASGSNIVQVRPLFSAPTAKEYFCRFSFFRDNFAKLYFMEKKLEAEINVSVRHLCEALYRSGGLAGSDYASIEGVEGIRAHQRAITWLKEQLPADALLKDEFSLTQSLDTVYGKVKLRGRADAVIFWEDEIQVVEIKSFRGPKLKLNPRGKEIHWAQAELYAAMLSKDDAYRQCSYKNILVYASVEEDDYLVLEREQSFADLEKFLHDSARLYLERIANIIAWRERRDRSILAAGFPYPSLREGQSLMMREVLAALRDKRTLFAEAPTGIGKTMATLYPALKALAAGFNERVFYATAMTSTREQVVKALEELRDYSGLLLRSLRLTAKEKICLQKDLFCEQNLCPYAVGYYDRLPEALAELLRFEALDAAIFQALGEKYKLCPFELSLDLALYCDVIIGDYNHIFDPRIRLKRFFEDPEEGNSTAILVDEAHNLAARSRSMFSASIDLESLKETAKIWQEPLLKEVLAPYTAFRDTYFRLIIVLEEIKQIIALEDIQKAIDSGRFDCDNNILCSKSEKQNWFLQGDFLALKQRADKIVSVVGRTLKDFRLFLDEQRDFPGRRKLLLTYFDLLHFHKIGSDYFNRSYITAVRKHKDNLHLAFLCLDAANYLSEVFLDKHPAVFFSATLYPLDYYENLIYDSPAGDKPESLSLSSPFPQEHRLLLLDTSCSLRYKDRDTNIDKVLHLIYEACAQKTANYLVFVPSYAYLKQLESRIKLRLRPENTRFIRQWPGMSEEAKEQFLAQFKQHGEKTLIGLAVLGGSFSEGIDLSGEELSGVICVGVGLPGLSPERQVLAEYCEEKFGSGFLYAYVFPAWQNIQQASGRLIRSSNDKGFILLIDQRWETEPYRSLISPEMNPHYLVNQEDLSLTLQNFWQQFN